MFTVDPTRSNTVSILMGSEQPTVERRRELRVKVNIPAKVKGLHPLTSSGPYSAATVVEISRSGLRLLLGREFLPGAQLQVIAGKEILLGRVRHCSQSGDEYVVGVQLVEGILATQE